jgi:polyphenol oxidase
MKQKYRVFLANKNKKLKKIYLQFKTDSIPVIKMKQSHSNNIQKIIHPPTKQLTSITNTDAVYTSLPNIALTVKFADCMPLIIYHPKKIACVIHAGRVGTQKKIVKKTLQKLISELNTTENYEIYIGAHLCKQCHEINSEKKIHYNLYNENLLQIKSVLNLTKNSLKTNNECTKCGTNFYSYRGDKKTKKRNFLFCMIS